MTDADLPAPYHASDTASKHGQDRTRHLIGWELSLLVLAAASGLASLRVGKGELDVLAAVGLASFSMALVLSLVRAKMRPEEQWYRGRAAAESIKTLAWRFAVGGDPFPINVEAGDIAGRLLTRIDQVRRAISDIPLPPTDPGRKQVTVEMERVRGALLDERRAQYTENRIENQIGWYSKRSMEHGSRATFWTRATVASIVVGIAGAFGRFVGWFDVSLLGIGAAGATAGSAWTQLNQHRALRIAYSIAQQDLTTIRDRLPTVPDDEWSVFVSDAEDAISREHTVWLARHGHPGLSGGS